MELHIKIIGYILIVLAFLHLIFPWYFKWKKDLGNIILINRQMMYVHTFFIALVVLLGGLLCVTSSKELIETRLGGRLAFGMFIFWGFRLIIQFVGYTSQTWKGKRFETTVHILFSILWLYLTLVFLIIFWVNKSL